MSGEWGTREAARFGIEPDTGVNMAERMREFVRSGLAEGVHTFKFGKGTYQLSSERGMDQFAALMAGEGSWDLGEHTADKAVWLACEGVERITLDFQHATLLFSGLIQPFCFDGCGEVTVRNVVLDWARPLYSQGQVTAITADGIEVQVEPEYPVSSGMPAAALLDYDPAAAHPLRGTVDWFHAAESTEQIGEQRLLIRLKERYRKLVAAGKLTPGAHLVIRHIMNYKAALLFHQCLKATIENVTIYTAPGMGIIGHGCTDVAMSNVRIMRKPGSGRVMSTNTDATHFIGCRGLIEFENCLFEGMGDDAANVHGFYCSIGAQLDERSVLCAVDADIQSEFREVPASGDRLEWTRRETLRPYATRIVEETQQLDDGTFIVRFTEPLPPELLPDDLLANTDRIAQLRFCSNVVRNNRARALLVQTRGALISGNTFDHCTGTAIHINCADYWKESISTQDVQVVGNAFIACGFGAGVYRGASALALMAECKRIVPDVHHRFAFTDNIVNGTGSSAPTGISLEGLSGGRVANNHFIHIAEAVHVDATSCHEVQIE
ncbi:right-handed parallel beta-helix repeat-containing protein [Paenibacillaceae bacterium]|nr:right-handed parallel beta-helix repeat-containing protein [Paenibacillaceae bacterium]